jgi:hypothetical protein
MSSVNWNRLHFNKIAKVIREKRKDPRDHHDSTEYWLEIGRQDLLNELTLEFAEYFRDQNPSFDANGFIEACGYTGGKNES